MRLWKKGLLAATGLAAGLAVTSAFAQNYTAAMDSNQWHRLWDHFRHVQDVINSEERSGVLPPQQAFDVQKELTECEVNALWQRFEPNGDNHRDIWGPLHHIHRVLGGAWDREFDRY